MTWIATDEDDTNGLRAPGIVSVPPAAGDMTAAEASTKLQATFYSFMSCLQRFAPTGYSETILRESTSFNWVLNHINEAYGLETKGEHFLALEDLKFEFDANYTFTQGFMEVKDFICAGLAKVDETRDGKIVTTREVISPTIKNFITKEWLMKINPRLPQHIRNTRGHLFTTERPSLACNQKVLADQMPTLLKELDSQPDLAQGNVTVGHIRGRGQVRNNMGRGLMRGAGVFGGTRPPATGSALRQTGCFRCLEATPRRYDSAQTHMVRNCPWPPNQATLAPGPPRQYRQQQPNRANQPNFRVVHFPDNTPAPQPQLATVSVQHMQHAQQIPAYDGPQQLYEESQFYDPGYYQEADIVEVGQDDLNFVEPSANKHVLYYGSDLSIQSIQCSPDRVSIQNIPIRKVQTIASEVEGKVVKLTIDSGSEGDCIRLDECKRLNLTVLPLDNDKDKLIVPTQADGHSPLDILGRAKFDTTRGKVTMHFDGYVARDLNAEILCGAPFMERNKLVQELHNKRIIVDAKYVFLENSRFCPNPIPTVSVKQVINDISDQKSDSTENNATQINKDLLTKIEVGNDVPANIKHRLNAIHVAHESVFDGNLKNGYNGYSGNFDVDFNFKGGIPPTPNYHSVPRYTTKSDEILMQAKIDELEQQGIVIKVAGTDIIPKYAAPCMLQLKHSARELPPGSYEKLTIQEKCRYNRFILCHDKLSENVEKQPAKVNKIYDTTRVVGSYKHVITSDLTDSFWQRHVVPDKYPYFAFHSPFRGAYIFLRSTQGLINQSEGLEELVSVVLQDCIMSGWCQVLADNVYVLGNTYEETVQRWQMVLDLMSMNNLKLSARKTACFPTELDLLGWKKRGDKLIPDPHRQNRLAACSLPLTVKQLRSYLGGYRTFYRCKENMAEILKDMEELQAGKKSSDKLEWTEHLRRKFEDSKLALQHLDELYLPHPDDQLAITSDWSEKGISATLWAMCEEEPPKVVARFSARLQKSFENILKAESLKDVKSKTFPCDGEMSAVFVAVKSPTFSTHIRASNKRTVSLVDSKPVVEAARLIKSGKFSSSRVINNLMTSISEHHIEFQHVSAKMGQNFPDDFSSRNPATCGALPSCKICGFIKDCEQLTVGSMSFSVTENAVIGHVAQVEPNLIQDILLGKKTIPFNNRSAMKYLQDQDQDLVRLREYLTTAKRPTARNTRENSVKRYLMRNNEVTIAKDGCLVAMKRDNHLRKRELVIVPEDMSKGLLYALHINLNHPSLFQLEKVFDTRFFTLDKEKKSKEIFQDCNMCQAVARIPEEIHAFKPNSMPDHPGQAFTVDVLKLDKKKVLVATDNFSGFIATLFIKSEQQEDLENGIIQTITPFEAASLATVRVDQAPAFKAIMVRPANLREVGIELEPGECKNKNALALVDRKMQKLEIEIKKAAPSKKTLNVKVLAKATTVVNEKIRHQGFSAKEILFSHDQNTLENQNIEDETLANREDEDKRKRKYI